MASFETLDTEYKADKGCRGVGRLLWLKAFKHVEVNSIYLDGDTLKRRKFRFDVESGVSNLDEEIIETGERSTTVNLVGFDEKYRKDTYKTLGLIYITRQLMCLV